MNMKQLKSMLSNYDKDDILEYIGLETKRTTAETVIPSVTMFGIGILVGAGIGLLLAPKPGSELRDDLRQRLEGTIDEVGASFPKATTLNDRTAPKSL